jgi:hypothetical protein
MQRSEHGNRGNGGAGKIGRDVLRDGGKAEDVDVQHLAGLPRRFEIRASVGSQTEVQASAGGGLLHDFGVTFELIANSGSDEIRAVRIKSVLHHQVDVAQVDISKIDGDFFGFRRLWPQFLEIWSHDSSIGHLHGWYMDVWTEFARSLSLMNDRLLTKEFGEVFDMSWIDEVKDRPAAKEFVEIAGKERIARAADEAARHALARVLVNHARKAGLDLHEDAESLTEKLAIYANQERLEFMIGDMDKMTDVRQFLRDHNVGLIT